VDVQVKTNMLSTMGLIGTNEVQLNAKANINVTDAVTGALLCSASAGNSPNFFQTVIDGGTKGTDEYGVNVYINNGATLYKSILLQVIGGGQIIVHTK
jgi:hypothetical protein